MNPSTLKIKVNKVQERVRKGNNLNKQIRIVLKKKYQKKQENSHSLPNQRQIDKQKVKTDNKKYKSS